MTMQSLQIAGACNKGKTDKKTLGGGNLLHLIDLNLKRVYWPLWHLVALIITLQEGFDEKRYTSHV